MKKMVGHWTKKNGEVLDFTVMVEEETEQALLATGDEKLINDYLIEEYKLKRKAQCDRRHCVSLERAIANEDWDAEDKSVNIEKQVMAKMEWERILSCLSDEQKWFVTQRFVLGKTQSQMAKQLGVSCVAITERWKKIKKRIKNFLIGA